MRRVLPSLSMSADQEPGLVVALGLALILDTGFFRVMTAGGGGSAAGQGSVTAMW